jgi:hypothetical protein
LTARSESKENDFVYHPKNSDIETQNLKSVLLPLDITVFTFIIAALFAQFFTLK